MTVNATWRHIAEQVSAGRYPYQILREGNKEGLVARVAREDGRTAILKYWYRPGLGGLARRITRTGTAWQESAALVHLMEHGMRVPKVYGVFALDGSGARHTECLVEEDLGDCRDSTEYLKGMMARGDAAGETAFENEIIHSTRIMVQSRLLDTDHRLPNYIVPASGKPVRLDFELARRVADVRLHPKAFGIMFGTLLGSYVFAVQPDEERMHRFAARLMDELDPPAAVLRIAERRIQEMIERQKKESGLSTRFVPPWQKGYAA